MQLVQYIYEVYLVGLLYLALDYLAKLVVELLGQVGIRFFVDDSLHSTIGPHLRMLISLMLFYGLFTLLIYGLLMQHVEGAFLVSGTH